MTNHKTITAKEIADDVQQTFDNVSNSYRQVLEDRINKLLNENMLVAYNIGHDDGLANSSHQQSNEEILKRIKSNI